MKIIFSPDSTYPWLYNFRHCEGSFPALASNDNFHIFHPYTIWSELWRHLTGCGCCPQCPRHMPLLSSAPIDSATSPHSTSTSNQRWSVLVWNVSPTLVPAARQYLSKFSYQKLIKYPVTVRHSVDGHSASFLQAGILSFQRKYFHINRCRIYSNSSGVGRDWKHTNEEKIDEFPWYCDDVV